MTMTSAFRTRSLTVQAVQWFRNGDHPQDDLGMLITDILTGKPYERTEGRVVRYFRRPDIPGTDMCPNCCLNFHDHGWIDRGGAGYVVCPGDWVLTSNTGEYYPCPEHLFKRIFLPVAPRAVGTRTLLARLFGRRAQ